jgi:hypothetical protein
MTVDQQVLWGGVNDLPVFIAVLLAVIISVPSLCAPPAINLPSLFITGLPGVITVLC